MSRRAAITAIFVLGVLGGLGVLLGAAGCEGETREDCVGTNPSLVEPGCQPGLCPEPLWCPPEAQRCVPSSCRCENGTWACTADCGYSLEACVPRSEDGDATDATDATDETD